MMSTHPLVLQLDAAGNPVAWIPFEKAIYYQCKDLIAWSIGEDGYTVWGGKSRLTGTRSSLDVNTIIAVRGELGIKHVNRTPSLANRYLFRRDQFMCAYCGQEYTVGKLTRDHIMPKSRGGKDRWENVVTACGSCNKAKDNMTLEEADMKLLYVPYAPCKSEHLLLSNRTILADQMEFLKSRVPKHSRIHTDLKLNLH